MRELRRSFNYSVLDCGERPVPPLFYDPVPGTSDPGIYADDKQVLKLLSGFQKRNGLICDVKV